MKTVRCVLCGFTTPRRGAFLFRTRRPYGKYGRFLEHLVDHGVRDIQEIADAFDVTPKNQVDIDRVVVEFGTQVAFEEKFRPFYVRIAGLTTIDGKLAVTVDICRHGAGLKYHDVYRIGTDEDPDAHDPETWKASITAHRLARLIRQAGVSLQQDLDTILRSLIGKDLDGWNPHES